MPPQRTQVLSDREFQVEHTINASAAKVFQAYTDRDLIPQWWGAKGGDFRVEELDVRPGGKYRFVQRMPDGKSMASFGTYLEVQPVSRLVYTFATDQMTAEVRATLELRQVDGKTHLTLTNLCASKQARDSLVQFGASAGAKAAWNRLEDVLGNAAEKAPSPAGHLGYATLFVADQDRALQFYTKVLGFESRGEAPQPGGHRFIALCPPGQEQFIVLWPGTPGKSSVSKGNVPGHLILRVPDIDRAFAELKARGAPIEEHAPVKAPFASYITVIDPDGNRIMVQQQAWRAPGA